MVVFPMILVHRKDHLLFDWAPNYQWMPIILRIVSSEDCFAIDWIVIIFESETRMVPSDHTITQVCELYLLEEIVEFHEEPAIINFLVPSLGSQIVRPLGAEITPSSSVLLFIGTPRIL